MRLFIRSRPPTRAAHRRRGVFSPMIIVLLVVSGVLLGVGALCLHTVLRSDQNEQHTAMLLRSLTRLEQQLRKDLQTVAAVQVVSASELRFEAEAQAGGLVTYRTSGGAVERIEGDLSSPIAFERFGFPKETSIEFDSGSGGVLVRIREGQPGLKYPEQRPV
ncbi:MAG: hypothetical protein RL215_1707, partial [Planctomycetota bacterium]